jgi:hypothetical protein
MQVQSNLGFTGPIRPTHPPKAPTPPPTEPDDDFPCNHTQNKPH